MAIYKGSSGQKMTRIERNSLRKQRNIERKNRNIVLDEERRKVSVKVTGLRSAVRTGTMSAEEALKKLNSFDWVVPSTKKWYERRIK